MICYLRKLFLSCITIFIYDSEFYSEKFGRFTASLYDLIAYATYVLDQPSYVIDMFYDFLYSLWGRKKLKKKQGKKKAKNTISYV